MKNAATWWGNLSIFKRLYGVVGVMALLIALELFTLRFAMSTLSAVRAFVGGEGLWSKAQKTAVSNLEKYVLSKDPEFFQRYLENLKVPLGDHKARLGMERSPPDLRLVYEGFIEGRIHPEDVPGLVSLFERFQSERHLAKSIALWREGDRLMSEFMAEGERIKSLVSSGKMNARQARQAIARIEEHDRRLTEVEDAFSYSLGEGSRWLETTVLLVLLMAVITIEGTGLFLTFTFGRRLSKGLRDITAAAVAIGQGEFSQRVEIFAKDELGKLGESINQMAIALENSVGERHQAERASQWKSLFLANMSHEIRTPMGAILGFTEILQDPSLPGEERNRYLEIVRKAGGSLNKIISDILDLSKVEAGRVDFEKSTFDLREFLSELREILELKAKGKNVALTFDGSGAIPETVFTDPVRLRQILMNLIGNSLKFVGEGGWIDVNYEVKGRELRFSVHDNGAGIPLEQQKTLFQPFSQASTPATRRVGGTGLGLFLSKRLARALDGDVSLVASSPGWGSTFLASVTIDGAPAVKASRAGGGLEVNIENLSLEGRRILIVDDTIENQILIRKFLSRTKAEILIAADGLQGSRMALAKNVDLVLMDMLMPVMDGYEATTELRRQGFLKPIIAITAHAMKEDRQRCLDAGCDDYLTKPVEARALLSMVSRFLANPKSESTAPAEI